MLRCLVPRSARRRTTALWGRSGTMTRTRRRRTMTRSTITTSRGATIAATENPCGGCRPRARAPARRRGVSESAPAHTCPRGSGVSFARPPCNEPAAGVRTARTPTPTLSLFGRRAPRSVHDNCSLASASGNTGSFGHRFIDCVYDDPYTEQDLSGRRLAARLPQPDAAEAASEAYAEREGERREGDEEGDEED
eukprot:3100416-Prymnesium_polylepis.2